MGVAYLDCFSGISGNMFSHRVPLKRVTQEATRRYLTAHSAASKPRAVILSEAKDLPPR